MNTATMDPKTIQRTLSRNMLNRHNTAPTESRQDSDFVIDLRPTDSTPASSEPHQPMLDTSFRFNKDLFGTLGWIAVAIGFCMLIAQL